MPQNDLQILLDIVLSPPIMFAIGFLAGYTVCLIVKGLNGNDAGTKHKKS